MRNVMLRRVLGVALFLIAATAGTAQAAVPPDRYGFVRGCYSFEDSNSQLIAPASGPFRMQATTLGEYLLYGVNQDFLADPGTGIPAPAAAPSTAAEWEVLGNPNTGYSLKNKATSNVIAVTPLSGTGCADYPEASTGVLGRLPRAQRNTARVSGFTDAHMHWTGFRLFGSSWHCGRPFHKYGIPYALPDCAQYDSGNERPDSRLYRRPRSRAAVRHSRVADVHLLARPDTAG